MWSQFDFFIAHVEKCVLRWDCYSNTGHLKNKLCSLMARHGRLATSLHQTAASPFISNQHRPRVRALARKCWLPRWEGGGAAEEEEEQEKEEEQEGEEVAAQHCN